MRLSAVLLVAASLLTIGLAGCVADEKGPAPPEAAGTGPCSGHDTDCVPPNAITDDGRDLRRDLTAADEVPAPEWQVGDVFEVHFYFGGQDNTGEHIQTIMVEDTDTHYVLATTSETAARDEATWDYPVLGQIGKAHLATSGFGVAWDWMYEFPLSDGQTWQKTVELFNFNTFDDEVHDATFTATYAAAIDTPHGDYPGIEIVATTEAGTLIEYNYVPAIQWFSHLWVYDQTTDDPADIFFHAMSMGVSHGYTGPYHLHEGREAFADGFATFPIAVLGGGVPPASIPPTTTFSVSEGATTLRGIMGAFVLTGSSVVRLDLPDMSDITIQADHHDGDPEGFGFAFEFVEIPAQPGEHRISNAGAGLGWGAFAILVEITEHTYELEASAPDADET